MGPICTRPHGKKAGEITTHPSKTTTQRSQLLATPSRKRNSARGTTTTTAGYVPRNEHSVINDIEAIKYFTTIQLTSISVLAIVVTAVAMKGQK